MRSPRRGLGLPRLTRSVLPSGLEPEEVDARVREITGRGEALYRLDEPALAELEPDLIVTQALCAVCAVSYDDVRAVAGRLGSRPSVISLDPKRLGQVLDDLVTLADACGDRARGVELRAAWRGASTACARRCVGRSARGSWPSSGSTLPTSAVIGCPT